MGFPRQEYCSGLTFPSPGIFPTQGLNLRLLALQVDSSLTELPGKPVIVIVLKSKSDHSIYLKTCYGLLAHSKHSQTPVNGWACA